MNDAIPSFSSLEFKRPDRDNLKANYAIIDAFLDQGDHAEALKHFDEVRRAYESWASLVHLQFSRDTTNENYKKARDYADALTPVATGYEVETKRRLLKNRDALTKLVGEYVARLWDADITTFDARIEKDLEEEARLSAEYTALLASARIEWDGQHLNLSGLVPYLQSNDRDTRHRAEQARWAFLNRTAQNWTVFSTIWCICVRKWPARWALSTTRHWVIAGCAVRITAQRKSRHFVRKS